MRRTTLLCFFLLITFISSSQVIYKEIHSEKLGTSRKLKIQLPRNYDSNTKKRYPIILVLDGDYLFEPVAGNVDYASYWENMPESIVVGVLQNSSRFSDCSYDPTTYFPDENGSKFFEFLGMELVPYLDSNYRTAKFIIGIGHDFTANFLNYYLFKSPPLLNGYIMLSPDLAPNLDKRIAERIPNIAEEPIFYYLATGSDDIKNLKKGTEDLNLKLSKIKSNSFNYYFDNFPGTTHYSLVELGIPSGLNKIFSLYRPITPKEYSDVLLKTETPISKYLVDKYKDIESLFGISNTIPVNDFIATAKAAEDRKQWDSLREIATLAQKQYPNTVLGPYLLGRYYEGTGDTKKAMKTYQSGYDKKEVDFITPDKMLERASKIKNDFGY